MGQTARLVLEEQPVTRHKATNCLIDESFIDTVVGAAEQDDAVVTIGDALNDGMSRRTAIHGADKSNVNARLGKKLP